MKSKQIEGIAVFSENGEFFFDSGLPAKEPVLEFETKPRRGMMNIEKNACATFVPEKERQTIPPQFDQVLKDGNLLVRRTSRNFIVSMKFPIVESAEASAKAQKAMWTKSVKAMKTEREKIAKELN